MDAAAADPERVRCALLATLGLPTVVVQEGGYDLATIGELVVAALTGFAEA